MKLHGHKAGTSPCSACWWSTDHTNAFTHINIHCARQQSFRIYDQCPPCFQDRGILLSCTVFFQKKEKGNPPPSPPLPPSLPPSVPPSLPPSLLQSVLYSYCKSWCWGNIYLTYRCPHDLLLCNAACWACPHKCSVEVFPSCISQTLTSCKVGPAPINAGYKSNDKRCIQ